MEEAVQKAEIVITMLPSGKEVEDVYQAIFPMMGKGALLIDCSTIDAKTTIKVAQQAKAYGFFMIDAPVSGGVVGAKAGTLTFMVGGDEESFAKAEPILLAMGKPCFHAGGHGAGQIAKICNNMLLGASMIATYQALLLGTAHGLDPKTLSEIMKKSSGRNWVLEVNNPYPGVASDIPAVRHYEG